MRAYADAINARDLDEPDDDPEPRCPDCGCDLFTEEHALDCGYDDEEEGDD